MTRSSNRLRRFPPHKLFARLRECDFPNIYYFFSVCACSVFLGKLFWFWFCLFVSLFVCLFACCFIFTTRKDHRNGYMCFLRNKNLEYFKTITNVTCSSLFGISEFASQMKRTEKFQAEGIGAFEL